MVENYFIEVKLVIAFQLQYINCHILKFSLISKLLWPIFCLFLKFG